MKGSRKGIKQKSRKRVLAFVQHAVEVIARRLLTELGVDKDRSEEIARDCAHDICSRHGGGFMYVPKDLEFELTKRDREIFERFNGANLHELVEQYKVTHTRIYQIVAQVRADELRKRQGRLPGLDDETEPA